MSATYNKNYAIPPLHKVCDFEREEYEAANFTTKLRLRRIYYCNSIQ